MSAQLKCEIETTYINTWVETGVYSLVVNTVVASQMLRFRIDLLDVNFVLRTGFVVRSDMLGSRGLWMFAGGPSTA